MNYKAVINLLAKITVSVDLTRIKIKVPSRHFKYSHDQDTLAEYVDQNAMDADHGSQLHIEPAYDLRHQCRCRFIRYQSRNTVIVAKFQHIFVWILIPAEHQ